MKASYDAGGKKNDTLFSRLNL